MIEPMIDTATAALPDLATTQAAPMTEAEARAITDQIKVDVEALWDLIAQAYTRRAWKALGYDSWDSYVFTEFDGLPLRLPRKNRIEMVCALRKQRLSERAIASVAGVSQSTIRDDLRLSRNYSVDLDEPATVISLDSRRRPARRPAGPKPPGPKPTPYVCPPPGHNPWIGIGGGVPGEVSGEAARRLGESHLNQLRSLSAHLTGVVSSAPLGPLDESVTPDEATRLRDWLGGPRAALDRLDASLLIRMDLDG
jgi:hypothetical protein